MAIWLPLFAGNALAMTVTMQTMTGQTMTGQTIVRDSHAVQMRGVESHHSGHVATLHQSPALVGNMAEVHCGVHDQDTHSDCGVCAFACSGHAVTTSFEIAKISPSLQSPMSVPLRFISTTFKPLLPPPLA